jgi:hypothetical protein
MKVKIRKVNGFSPEFSNLVEGSIHETLEPPKRFRKLSGVWVMGVNEPIRLLPGEYTILDD